MCKTEHGLRQGKHFGSFGEPVLYPHNPIIPKNTAVVASMSVVAI